MPDRKNAILAKLLDRLYASIVSGPALNCRVHRSRQRLDLRSLSALASLSPDQAIPRLLSERRKAEIAAKVRPGALEKDEAALTPEEKEKRAAFERQARVLNQLRDIAEDARDYEQETGENALYIGFPLISIPPGYDAVARRPSGPRILAPAALVAVDLVLKRGAFQSATFSAKGSGIDLVTPNHALLAWLEQLSGEDTSGLFEDEEGARPYEEINEIVRLIAGRLQIPAPPEITPETPLETVPRAEELGEEPRFVLAAVAGLFPLSNQGLLRDMKAMAAGENLDGPVAPFLTAAIESPDAAREEAYAPPPKRSSDAASDRLVAAADPCQSRAVRLAKETPRLVIHGPPGSGKSQTIANIIGDHLARGERVLMICDKRTAIDVVKNRLDALGLGGLCAVVHDAQRDQRRLYLNIREQLDALAAASPAPDTETDLSALDVELQRIHDDLRGVFSALMEPPNGDAFSFHQLMGEWMTAESATPFDPEQAAQATLADLQHSETEIRDAARRALSAGYPDNPWLHAAGLELGEALSQPLAHWRKVLERLVDQAESFDASCPAPELPLDARLDLALQAEERARLAAQARRLARLSFGPTSAEWLELPLERREEARRQIAGSQPALARLREPAAEPELEAAVPVPPPDPAQINSWLEALRQFDEVQKRWYRAFVPGRKAAAQAVAARFGLAIDDETSARLRLFLERLKARFIVRDVGRRFLLWNETQDSLSDAEIAAAFDRCAELLDWVHEAEMSQTFATLRDRLAAAARAGDDALLDLARQLEASSVRASGWRALLETLEGTGVFAGHWRAALDRSIREGESAAASLAPLAERMDTLEDALRFRQSVERLPPSLFPAVSHLMREGATPDAVCETLRKALMEKEIARRLRENPVLQQVDGGRIELLFDRQRDLERRKRERVRQAILNRWLSRQQGRLLASTGTQLNSSGAALKRRLLTRGQRAMKLRQMIQQGRLSGEPDPLFDMCPVWMASPGAAAQIFPREALFDILIFDEASQCRLEEAVPVLTRGKRVVIAGDPKQLPPTRFFEFTPIGGDAPEAEDDQELFEQQLSETEDLLSAALNIEAEQCYLDVHYRSKHEGLIGFSNRNFYDNRLQPLPAHPDRERGEPPIHFLHVDGQYDKRGNAKEAEAVARIVRELLDRPAPPSIGVACFNLVQRDLILDQLDAMADGDPEFAAALEQSRARTGEGAFEGLFVKNLENVQGDERDHMIISTTFGPDAQGRFRRNFGPVGRTGGGRRLNVLVTRARERIHLVTSIPRTEYRSLPPIEKGQIAGGRWILYAYLQYAAAMNEPADAHASPSFPLRAPALGPRTERGRSKLVDAFARRLADRNRAPVETDWGSEGLRVDVVVRAESPASPALGVLCDWVRYPDAADPVEWEMFRTGILESQGWRFHRVWSPRLYTDPDRQTDEILNAAQASHPREETATETPERRDEH